MDNLDYNIRLKEKTREALIALLQIPNTNFEGIRANLHLDPNLQIASITIDVCLQKSTLKNADIPQWWKLEMKYKDLFEDNVFVGEFLIENITKQQQNRKHDTERFLIMTKNLSSHEKINGLKKLNSWTN